MGVSKIFLTGYTPSPIDEFGNFRKGIHKTALDAEKFVEWKKIKDIGQLIKSLKNEGVYITAVEQDKKAIDYRRFRAKFPLALVFGNEVRGLDQRILKKCDKILEIPMRGKKESLNVAVAAGVILYSLIQPWSAISSCLKSPLS